MISFCREDIFLVTGASSGLGKATSLLLNSLGATVIIVSRSLEELQKVKNESSFPDSTYIEVFDFMQIENINDFIKSSTKKYGKLSGLVHFAGMGNLYPLRATSVEMIQKIFNINFFSAYEITKSINDKRVKRSDGLSLVLVSSISSIRSFEGLSAYGSSKGAINSLVISSAVELAKSNVRINSIIPGHIETNMTQSLAEFQNEEYKQEILSAYPLGAGKAKDIANLTIFLLSNVSRWITGQNITIDGGRTLI